MADLNDLKMVEETLSKNIKKLQAQESNLKESIRTEEIRADNKNNLDKAEIDGKIQEQKVKLTVMEDSLRAEKIKIESIKSEVNDRLTEIEKREKRLLNLEEEEGRFREERKHFQSWKNAMEKELEEVKISMAEYEDTATRLKVKEDAIFAREKSIVIREKEYMDRVGELSKVEKEVQTKIEHLESLQKEAVNV